MGGKGKGGEGRGREGEGKGHETPTIWRKFTPMLASIELSFHLCNILRDSRRGVSRGNKNVGCGM